MKRLFCTVLELESSVATHPEDRGGYLAMKAALRDASIDVGKVDLISAHATSTEVGDLSETMAIKKLFDNLKPIRFPLRRTSL